MLEIVILILLILAGLWAVMAPNLLKAAIGLAVASAILAIIMFNLNATLAAVFELSVCAGLITVVFISVISLTRQPSDREMSSKKILKRFAFLPLVMLLAALGLAMLMSKPDFNLVMAQSPSEDMRLVLWGQRQMDLLGQVVVLLTAVFGVVVLFKERKRQEKEDME